jgi:hypothetical protein
MKLTDWLVVVSTVQSPWTFAVAVLLAERQPDRWLRMPNPRISKRCNRRVSHLMNWPP